MRRRLSTRPEILRGADQTATEQVQPEVIHRHPRRQWILRRSNPTREIEAIHF